MIRVLVVDDHPIFRTGVLAILSCEPDLEVVGEASSAAEAMSLISTYLPDVLLTDVRLRGDVNGIDLAGQVRASYPSIKIVVLTNFSNEPYIRAMMEMGVEGYMLKDTPPRDVIDSIRMVMDGRTVFSAQVTRTLVRGYLGPPGSASGAVTEHITKQESRVLQMLVEGSSDAEIAQRLQVAVGTVRYHLGNIYSKLGVKSRSEAVIQAARNGIIVIDE